MKIRTTFLLLLQVTFLCLLYSCGNDNTDGPDNPDEETIFTPNESSVSCFVNGVSLTSEDSDIDIGFYTNKRWIASITYTGESKDWITLNEYSGNPGDNVITIKVSENDEYNNRSAVMTISVGGNNEYISIEQTSNPHGVIDIKVPGSLADYLPTEVRPFITELTIKGKINGTDIKIIRSLFGLPQKPQLQKLDMSEATIVSGGDNYEVNMGEDCMTEDFAIGPYMFMGYNGTELSIPKNTKSIGVASFFHIPNVESLNIPKGLEFIADNVFSNCSSLKQLTIPSNVKPINEIVPVLSIGDLNNLESLSVLSPFLNLQIFQCENLKSIELYGGMQSINALPKLSSVILHDGITEIGNRNFQDCPKLKTITIPASVKRIGASAFVNYDITNLVYFSYLEEIHYKGTSSPWEGMLDGFKSCKLYVPKSALNNFAPMSSAFKEVIGE